jgi:hypothetical protein
MNYLKRFAVEPGTNVRLRKIAPEFKDKYESHENFGRLSNLSVCA